MADTPGLAVGRAFGVPVYLRPSWFVVAALLAVLYAPEISNRVPGIGSAAVLVGLALAMLLLLSVFVHEVAHALAARAVGSPARHIVLDLWGGHTAFVSEQGKPWHSALVGAVGPLSNAVIGVAAGALARTLPDDTVVGLLVGGTALVNLFVALFNALPGLPLDGGRVLEALVWQVTGRRTTGTAVAGWSGRVVAVGLVVWVLRPFVTGGAARGFFSVAWLLLIAWFLWQGASQAVRVAHLRRRAPMASARDLLRPAVPVPSTATLAEAAEAATATGAHVVVVLDVYGRPASVVDSEAASQVPAERISSVPAAAVAEVLGDAAVVPVDLAGEALLDRLNESPRPRYAVVDDAGRVVGVLSWHDVAAFVAGR